MCRRIQTFGLAVGTLSLLALLPACSPYDTVSAPPPVNGVEIPILSDIHLIVDARINGMPAKVMLDTGTIVTSITSPGAIARFGLRDDGLNPFAGSEGAVGVCGGGGDGGIDPSLFVADTLELGGVKVDRLALTVLHESSHDTFAESGIDAIISAPVLVQMDWRVDDYGRRLTLLPAGSRPRPADALDLAVEGPGGLLSPLKITAMSLSARLSDTAPPRAFLLDTGGGLPMAVSNEVMSDAAVDLSTLPHVEQRIFGTGASCDRYLFRVPALSVGDRSFPDVVGLSLGDAGPLAILGWHFLTNHESVYVCPAGGWIELMSGPRTASLFAEPLRTFGLTLSLEGSRYRVVDMQSDSSAVAAGLETGEHIVKVNDVAVDTVEGKSLLFGREVQRAGGADFLVEGADGSMRTVHLTTLDLL